MNIITNGLSSASNIITGAWGYVWGSEAQTSTAKTANQAKKIPASQPKRGKDLKEERIVQLEKKLDKLTAEFRRCYPDAKNLFEYYDIIDGVNQGENFDSESVFPIPHYTLIKTDDLPAQFRAENIGPDSLENDQFLQDFADWSRKFLGMTPKPIDAEEKIIIPAILNILQNKHLSEAAKEFALAHEIAHNALDHGAQGSTFRARIKVFAIISTLVVIGVALALIFAANIYFLPVVLGAIGLILLNLVSLKAYICIRQRKREREADIVAAKINPRLASGGITLFREIREVLKKLRAKSWKYSVAIDSAGNCRWINYPPFTDRIEYLTPYLKSSSH